MTTAGARKISRASLVLVAGAFAWAFACGASFAQHAYTVGPPTEFYLHRHFGPVRSDTDADRSCLGGYNSEVPYTTNTCMGFGSQGFVMTRTLSAEPKAPSEPLNRPVEVADAIAACWSPPAGPARQITVRVAFSNAAKPIGPRITYVAAPDDRTKADLRTSLLDALKGCSALRFTPSLGRAIAGRPFAIRFILPARS